VIKFSGRRFASVLVLAGASLALTASAHADGVTGTDPCPKGWICVNSTPSQPSAATSSATTTSTAAATILALLGLA
jgi:hypothetical protein